jgi:RNA polymerase sigma-70 factor (ECF subfamily)
MEQVLEQRLIRRAKLGEAAAFTELIQEHQGRLFGFLFRICGKRELCEDMVQEAFVRVLRNIERFDERYRFSTWLFTIGRRLLLNALQKNRPLSESEWVESRESQARVSELLDEAMEVLSPIQREIVLLYHHNEHAVAEIADLLDMPAGTIKSHLHRARGRMREWIKSDSQKRTSVAELLGDAA